MQGRYLQRGNRLVDFDIRLGVAQCEALAPLTDNQVDCRPPANRPSRDVNDTFCHHDTLSLRVSSRYPTSAISVSRRQLKTIGHSNDGDADKQHRGVVMLHRSPSRCSRPNLFLDDCKSSNSELLQD